MVTNSSKLMKCHDKSKSTVRREAKYTKRAVNSETGFSARSLVETVESDKIMDQEKRWKRYMCNSDSSSNYNSVLSNFYLLPTFIDHYVITNIWFSIYCWIWRDDCKFPDSIMLQITTNH